MRRIIKTDEIGNTRIVGNLDLESTIDEQLRSRLIENIINISIPILQKLESIDGIIELYGEKPELNNIYPFSSILYRKEMNNKLKAI